MITEKVGKFTVRYPWIGIAVILLITFGAIFSMIQFPMEEKFSNEDFLPDVEVAQANTLYSDTFTSSYPFLVLVRDPDGDLVQPQYFSEMTQLVINLEENPTYIKWKDNGSATGPSSPASSMYNIRTSVDYFEGLKGSSLMYGSLMPSIIDINSTTGNFVDSLADTNMSDRVEVDSLLRPLEDEIESFKSNVAMPHTPEPAYTNALEYYDGFNSTEEFKQELGMLLAYDIQNNSIQEAIGTSIAFTMTGTASMGTITEAIEDIDALIENDQLNASTTERLSEIREDLEEVLGTQTAFVQMASSQGDPLVVGQVSQSFGYSQFFLMNFLTEDFDPENGHLEAEGAMIFIELDYSLNELEDEDNKALLQIERDLMNVVSEVHANSDLSYHSLAFARINERINEASNDSMAILLPAAMIFVFLILFAIYRSFIDILINGLALMMAIIWMYGFGSIMGFSSNPMITAVPVLLVGLGIDYGIHLTMRYREEIRKGKTVKEALTAMSASVGMALFLATFTTVFAFLSNATSPVGMLMQFGVMAAVGIFASFIIMLIFVPSTKRIIDVWKAKNKWSLFRGIKEGECDLCDVEKVNKRFPNNVILKLTIGAEKHPITIISVVTLATIIMLGFAVQNEVTFDVNDFLPDGIPESDDLGYLLTEFRLSGSGDSGIVIIEGDITDPAVLRAMDETMHNVVDLDSKYFTIEGTGMNARPNAEFILYSLKETAAMVGALDPTNPFILNYSTYFDYETGLPQGGATSEDVKIVFDMFYNGFASSARRVIHQEEGIYTMTAIAFTVVTEDDDQAWELFDELKEVVEPIEALEGGQIEKVSITGSTILMAVIIDSINSSQIRSLMITIVVSLVVLTIIFFIEERAILLGTVATLPVVLCVIWIAGTMYIVGIPMNVMTITIGALTVGLGITYGIHITHRFIEDIRENDDLLEASKKTIINTGSALFGAALTTIGGFGLLSFATMPPLQQFGQVTALAILYSFLSSVIVLPVLLIIWAKGKRKIQSKRSKEPVK